MRMIAVCWHGFTIQQIAVRHLACSMSTYLCLACRSLMCMWKSIESSRAAAQLLAANEAADKVYPNTLSISNLCLTTSFCICLVLHFWQAALPSSWCLQPGADQSSLCPALAGHGTTLPTAAGSHSWPHAAELGAPGLTCCRTSEADRFCL